MAERDPMRKPEHDGTTPGSGGRRQDWKQPQPVGDPVPGQAGVGKRIEDPEIDDREIDDPEGPNIDDREIEDPDMEPEGMPRGDRPLPRQDPSNA